MDEPVYGIYILNRMGTGDYVRRIYPEDDMEVFGKYLMYRYYPDFTERRMAMKLPYPIPDLYRPAFDAEFAKDNSEPDDPDPTKKRKMQGNSVTLGYWAFPQEAHEPLEDVMMRYVFLLSGILSCSTSLLACVNISKLESDTQTNTDTSQDVSNHCSRTNTTEVCPRDRSP
jgi:hypothetical protein